MRYLHIPELNIIVSKWHMERGYPCCILPDGRSETLMKYYADLLNSGASRPSWFYWDRPETVLRELGVDIVDSRNGQA